MNILAVKRAETLDNSRVKEILCMLKGEHYIELREIEGTHYEGWMFYRRVCWRGGFKDPEIKRLNLLKIRI